jgi:two-component system sensor histidine kinase HydH
MENNQTKDIYQQELDTILKFSALINSSLNIIEVLDNAMKWAEEFIDAEASSVYELEEDNNELSIRLARGEKKRAVEGLKLNVGEGIAGSVVATGKPVVIQDVRNDKRFSDKIDRSTGFKTRSMICVPLILRDKPVGALQVMNKRNREPFRQADLELLNSMAQLIAVAMENAKLYQRLEEKFDMTSQELASTQKKLIRSERLAAMGHLVQGVAHEIRNPIMTIGGFAHRIKRELNHNFKLQKYIDIILDESGRLERLVREVRDFSEIQSASLLLDTIEPAIHEVLQIFEPLAGNRHVKLSVEIADDLPQINLDSSQLMIAMSNIMENALESMPKGGNLTLQATRDDRHLLVSFRDTGLGIDPEQLDAIYDPFVTSKTRGAGLGLTMVYQIVMNHHGEITISSELDTGTDVTIQLPIPTDI